MRGHIVKGVYTYSVYIQCTKVLNWVQQPAFDIPPKIPFSTYLYLNERGTDYYSS